jgi:flagellar motor switch protein FliN/FliY
VNTETAAAAPADSLNADQGRTQVKPPSYNLLEDSGSTHGGSDIELVMDVAVQISVELGRSKMQIRHLLALGYGSVIELDVLAGDPLDVTVNGTLVAQGEVVIINDRYAIRLTDIVTPAERLRKLNR